MFLRALTVYIIASTKIKAKEMGQIIEALPKQGQEVLKTTYENIIDLGIERGIKKGIEKGIVIGKVRGEEINRLELTVNAIKKGLEPSFIVSFLEVSEKLIKLLKANLEESFQSKEVAAILAVELLQVFKNLDVQDIADFCHLNVEEVIKLKKTLS